MITFDFSVAVALYLAVAVVLVFFFWLWNKKKRTTSLGVDPKIIWFCSICTYNYINTKEDDISICPRCGSYNKRNK